MAGIRISLPNLAQTRASLRREREQVRREMNALVKRVGEKAVDRVRDLTPKDTGQTAAGWNLRTIGGNDKFQGATLAVVEHPYNEPGASRTVTTPDGRTVTQVVNDGTHNLLESLEYGTGPHLIQGNPFLTFMVDGQFVSTRSVAHPGTRAYGMTRIAAAEADQDVAVGLQRIVSNLRARLQRGIG